MTREMKSKVGWVIALALMTWAGFAFVLLEPNPLQWGGFARGMFAALLVFGSIASWTFPR